MIIQELSSNEMQWWMNENETLKIFAEDYNDSADLVDKGITRSKAKSPHYLLDRFQGNRG